VFDKLDHMNNNVKELVGTFLYSWTPNMGTACNTMVINNN